MRIYVIIVLSLFMMSLSFKKAQAQTAYQENGLYRLGGVLENGDTIAMAWLNEIIVSAPRLKKYARQDRKNKKAAEQYDRLRYNVYKVYPYAVVAGQILQNVDVELAKLEGDKKARRKYLDGLEKQLNAQFKGELEDLTISQGQILVKLINRQTGKNCFSIIRELKGGFSAVVWQSVGLLFNNNLKKEYDPIGADKDIETIVLQLEAYNKSRQS